jgi:hypothetical protein
VVVGGGIGNDADMIPGRHQYRVPAAAANDDEEGSTSTEVADAKKQLMARSDVILTKLLEDCANAESKRAASISKYYFHEALLMEQDECDATTLLAATEELDAAEDLKPSSQPIARGGKKTAPPHKEIATFDEKLAARKSKESPSEAAVHCERASKGSSASRKVGKRRSTNVESAEWEDGVERPKKRPAKGLPSADSLAVMDQAGNQLLAQVTNAAKSSKPAHSSTQHNEYPRMKTENCDDTNSAPLPSRLLFDRNDTKESSLSAVGGRRSAVKKSEDEVIELSSDEDNF